MHPSDIHIHGHKYFQMDTQRHAAESVTHTRTCVCTYTHTDTYPTDRSDASRASNCLEPQPLQSPPKQESP